MKDGRRVTLISNAHEGGRRTDGELLFHADHVFMPQPLKAISLYAMLLPSRPPFDEPVVKYLDAFHQQAIAGEDGPLVEELLQELVQSIASRPQSASFLLLGLGLPQK
jgi:hypothetical protein